MRHDELTHDQRDRAESFGAVADDYDRYRPGYPAALIDDLLATRPRTVLDIGCGTGKAAALLAARGPAVLGVEIDAKMAAVAGAHGIDVEVSRFEDWDDRGRAFDLVTCAQAWHWVNPAIGGPKVVRLLEPGGVAAFFWNFAEPDPPTRAALDPVYERVAPELVQPADAGDDQTHLHTLEALGCFASLTTHTYEWQRVEDAGHWIAYLGTQSNHLLLGRDRLQALQAELRVALAEVGGEVRLTGGTYVIWARP